MFISFLTTRAMSGGAPRGNHRVYSLYRALSLIGRILELCMLNNYVYVKKLRRSKMYTSRYNLRVPIDF